MIDGATDPDLHDAEKEKANKNAAKKTVQRDFKQHITPRESGARHEEDPPVDADPERASGNHAHGIPGGSAYSTNRRIHGWPVCV